MAICKALILNCKNGIYSLMGHYSCSHFFQGGLTCQKPDKDGTQQHGLQGYSLIFAASGGYSSSTRAVLAPE
jgi:hypothetical protein